MEKAPTLCLILKAPQRGFVKTRLAREIGNIAAVEIYRRLVKHQLGQLPRGWPVQIHYAPRSALGKMKTWLGRSYPYIPQGNGNLGKRLARAMGYAFKNGASSAIFLGGDCPYITKAILKKAEIALRKVDVILGPSKDGGYYLMGLKKIEPRLFRNIKWGSSRVFNQTIQRIQSLDLKYQTLKPLEDVDDLQTWTRACTRMRRFN